MPRRLLRDALSSGTGSSAQPGFLPLPEDGRWNAPHLAPRRARNAGGGLGGEERKLTVDKGPSLSGEITACDVAVVSRVSKLTGGKLLGNQPSSAAATEVAASPVADGDLTFLVVLTIRGTGRVSGMLRRQQPEARR